MRGLSLDITNNILAPNATGMANALQSKGIGLQGGLLAFLDILAAPAPEIAPGSELSAKIAELLQAKAPAATAIPALLAAAPLATPAAPEDTALPEAETTAAPPALLSDLTARFSAEVQEDPALVAELKEKFAAVLEDGNVTPDELAHFRKEAIDFLTEKGLDRFTIGKYLVVLANELGDELSTPLAAQLGLPVPAKAVATAETTVPPADAGTTPAEGETMTGIEFAVRHATPQPARAPQDQPAGLEPRQVQQAPQHALPDPARAAEAPARPQPQQQQQQHQPASLVLVNSFASAETAAGDTAAPLFTNSSGHLTSVTPAQAASPAFVNHMQASTETAPTAQLVAVQIHRNANARMDSFTMQLEPMELGRLEIRMKFGRNGEIKAHLIAEKPETLSMLQKDAPQIQRLLQAAGLEADEGSLSFDLRQHAQHDHSDNAYDGTGRREGFAPAARGAEALHALLSIETQGLVRQGGVNIIV